MSTDLREAARALLKYFSGNCIPVELAVIRADSAEVVALRAALAEDDGIGWQPIETAPTTGLKVILAYVNRNGKPRTVMGRWLTDEEAAEIDADDVGLEGGWYECIDNWDDYTEVAIHEGKPTHWMPLPAPPAAAEKETG